MAKSTLDDLHDDLYVLACAVDDAEADLEAAGVSPPAAELRRILDWVLEAARPLRNRELPAAAPAPAVPKADHQEREPVIAS